ncbi:hypothetical protein TKK_0006668 [Trichogramma kaykai]|uniref:TMC domain-containing protein n=1 Tax=Trichogramma kaykai TaxID=54128 RepID=A0ABD2XDR0_9HYME
MSSGERKKRVGNRSKGWEEAGAEFYQESYPGAACEVDIQQALERDPSKLATLLPSKKSRVVTTTKRVGHEPRTTLRRRTSTRLRYSTTTRRQSTQPDANASMLPDLSENLTNEKKNWEDIMQIKALPICMEQKKALKRHLQNTTTIRLQGCEQFKFWCLQKWEGLKTFLHQVYSKMGLWNSSLKHIGGNFGMGVVAYFLFIKWILFLNLFLFSIIMIFLVLPTILLEFPADDSCITANGTCCSSTSVNSTRNFEIASLFHGGHLLENTVLFYGAYSSSTYYNEEKNLTYKLPLAYVFVMIAVFAVSLFAIVRWAAKGFKQRVVENEGQLYHYCNLIFGGWDYCINNKKAASTKHLALYKEMKALLAAERFEDERLNRTQEDSFKLCFIRIIVNISVVIILLLSGIGIYWIIRLSFEKVANQPLKMVYASIDAKTVELWFYEFVPYLAIVLLNMVIPVLFNYLITLENYSPTFVVKLTLFRTIFLRLASLIVLLYTFYMKIAQSKDNDDCNNSKKPLCWETFVGQQFMKLYMTDVVSQFFLTFTVNLIRASVARSTKNKVIRYIGRQEFDLSKHVLDIVYLQTVCWLGTFFSPGLPLIAVIGSFLLFYTKKFFCMIICGPSKRIYRASKSQSLFMLILLICYILTIVPVVYSLVKMTPSKSCGPFKGLESSWTLLVLTYQQLPAGLRSILSLFSTFSFAATAFLILSFLLYYYNAVASANKNMVQVLRNQLVLEGHDKQFLLERLSAFIKVHQEQTKYQQEHPEFP